MEGGLHTWPKEKRSWRGFCHDWLAPDSQKSGLVEEVEVDHVEGAKQVRIRKKKKRSGLIEQLIQIRRELHLSSQRVDLYIYLLTISWLR